MQKLHFKIIGLHSLLPHSGKSTVANLMAQRHGGKVMSIATGIREIAVALGMPEAAYAQGDYKNQPYKSLDGRTPREVLIAIGNSLCEQFGDDLFVKKLLRDAASFIPSNGVLIIDDIRRQVEGDAVLAAGGTVVTLDRSGVPVIADVNGFKPQIVVSNNGALEDTCAAVWEVCGGRCGV